MHSRQKEECMQRWNELAWYIRGPQIFVTAVLSSAEMEIKEVEKAEPSSERALNAPLISGDFI